MKNDNTSQPAQPAKKASQTGAPAAPAQTELDINSLPFLCYQFTPEEKAEKLEQLKKDYPKFTERLINKALADKPKDENTELPPETYARSTIKGVILLGDVIDKLNFIRENGYITPPKRYK
jgi:hypothetical protein